MRAVQTRRATQAALSSAASLGLTVSDVTVLHDSNTLTLRLQPCDVVARVSPARHQCAQLEVDVASGLAAAAGPVAALVLPQVFVRGDQVVTLWAYHEPVTTGSLSSVEYADALVRLHAGMRQVDVATPHFTDRVAHARALVGDPARTPALTGPDRAFLAATLDRLQRAAGASGRPEQLLHGEPHPGNLLRSAAGPLFIDFETCCRGPVEFDVAHAPDAVGDLYPGLDRELLRDCRTLVLALITAWRWDRDDQLPDGRRLGAAWLSRLRQTAAH